MPITLDEVRKVALLARLHVPEAELERLAADMEKIVEYVESLASIDTAGVAPQSQFVAAENVLRDDKIVKSLPKSEALRNAPKKDSDYFLVPKVIG